MGFPGMVSPAHVRNGIGVVLIWPGEDLLGLDDTLRGDPASPEVGPEVGMDPPSVLALGGSARFSARRGRRSGGVVAARFGAG